MNKEIEEQVWVYAADAIDFLREKNYLQLEDNQYTLLVDSLQALILAKHQVRQEENPALRYIIPVLAAPTYDFLKTHRVPEPTIEKMKTEISYIAMHHQARMGVIEKQLREQAARQVENPVYQYAQGICQKLNAQYDEPVADENERTHLTEKIVALCESKAKEANDEASLMMEIISGSKDIIIDFLLDKGVEAGRVETTKMVNLWPLFSVYGGEASIEGELKAAADHLRPKDAVAMLIPEMSNNLISDYEKDLRKSLYLALRRQLPPTLGKAEVEQIAELLAQELPYYDSADDFIRRNGLLDVDREGLKEFGAVVLDILKQSKHWGALEGIAKADDFMAAIVRVVCAVSDEYKKKGQENELQ